MTTFSTWSVNSVVGPIYAGIPSRDVAIAMAIDLQRYSEDDEDEDEDEDRLVRHELATQFEEECGVRFTLVVRTDVYDRGVGVCEEHRCEMCRRRE